MKRLLVIALATLLGSVLGCQGEIADPTSERPPLPRPRDLDPPPPTVEECADITDVSLVGMRRLTHDQYNHVVRDIFGDGTNPADEFAFALDGESGGFHSNATSVVGDGQLESYLEAAEDVATRYVAGLGDDCAIDQTDCATSHLEPLATLAFRRPVEGELLDSLVAVYEDARERWDATTGMRLALETILMSPHFLYLVELEPSGDGPVANLDAYETATRLSFFLWNTAPDQELLDAAGRGELATTEGITAQARRLMADERFVDGLESFHFQWLGLDESYANEKDPEVYPDFTSEQAAAARRSARAFLRHVFFESDGTIETLLTSAEVFVDAESAPLFGVAPPEEMTQMTQPERSGILTQPRWLASRAKHATVSWVTRGLVVRHDLLCQTLPPPPDDVDMMNDLDPSRVTNADCRDCHTRIDPIGRAFDQFDAVGRYRNDPDVDTNGYLLDVDGDPEFNGVQELMSQLVGNTDVEHCISEAWLRFATASQLGEEDACTQTHVHEALTSADGDLREALVAIVTSDLFRLRRVSEESP